MKEWVRRSVVAFRDFGRSRQPFYFFLQFSYIVVSGEHMRTGVQQSEFGRAMQRYLNVFIPKFYHQYWADCNPPPVFIPLITLIQVKLESQGYDTFAVVHRWTWVFGWTDGWTYWSPKLNHTPYICIHKHKCTRSRHFHGVSKALETNERTGQTDGYNHL